MAHSFQWIQGALGIIVALGMTRLIVSVVHMHVARRTVRLDWIPFVWALSIFFLLLQFSWMFVALEPVVPKWTFGVFLMLLGFVLTLFVAAALILPNTESQAGVSLENWFQQDGRYALLFLSAYALLAYFFNWYFVGEGPESNPASGLFVTLSMTTFMSSSRLVRAGATILALLLTMLLVVAMIIQS